jgi:hypothetical protein
VAALLAIAAIGAVVAARFEAVLDRPGSAAEPLSGGSPAVEEASAEGFEAGMVLGGGLVILGGVVSLVGIVNPRRPEEHVTREEPGAVRIAQPCPDCREPAASEAA